MAKDFSKVSTLGDYCEAVRSFVINNAQSQGVTLDENSTVEEVNRFSGSSNWMTLGEEGTLTNVVEYNPTLRILTTTTVEGSQISISHLLQLGTNWKVTGDVTDSHQQTASASVEPNRSQMILPTVNGKRASLIQVAEMIANGDFAGKKVRKYGTAVRLQSARNTFTQNGIEYKVGESYCRTRSLYCEC